MYIRNIHLFLYSLLMKLSKLSLDFLDPWKEFPSDLRPLLCRGLNSRTTVLSTGLPWPPSYPRSKGLGVSPESRGRKSWLGGVGRDRGGCSLKETRLLWGWCTDPRILDAYFVALYWASMNVEKFSFRWGWWEVWSVRFLFKNAFSFFPNGLSLGTY